VLKSFSANYTPTGRPSFYKDAGNENAPEAIQISMTFIEIEYWIRGDFNDSNDPFNTKP
jgi:hypothetical protein